MNTINQNDWDDFYKMFCDMKRHNYENNSSSILEQDDPLNNKLCWICGETGKFWSIKIDKVFDFIKIHESDENSDFFGFVHLLNKCLKTKEGKKQLSLFINSK